MPHYSDMTNTTSERRSGIAGTKTEENLHNAFGAEAKSHTRYTLLAENARRNGNYLLASKYDEMAQNEREHAGLWQEYLGEAATSGKSEVENAKKALAAEEYSGGVMYRDFADDAEKEGFFEIAEKMRMVGEVENAHAEALREYIDAADENGDIKSVEEKIFMCKNCGYRTLGTEAPERCPLCSCPKGYFVQG